MVCEREDSEEINPFMDLKLEINFWYSQSSVQAQSPEIWNRQIRNLWRKKKSTKKTVFKKFLLLEEVNNRKRSWWSRRETESFGKIVPWKIRWTFFLSLSLSLAKLNDRIGVSKANENYIKFNRVLRGRETLGDIFQKRGGMVGLLDISNLRFVCL